MKQSLFALMLGALVASAAVSAAPIQYDQDHDHYDHDHDRDHDHDHDHDRDHDHGNDHDRDHRDHDHDRRDYVIVHDRGRHEGWYHRGGYVPVEYRDRRYVVEDWQTYRLAPPPRDHQWVRSDDGEFVLVAVATGLIADIVINH
ncbi:MAG TPA: RcnB family protein [Dyella sp.]|uniref:RcnB family protein n=1 Tax=Dyella sp. TaxID=1869338 RepID=UPI002D789A06|nr:RcnB family protein [Dyella sp.]HET6553392.1 RcnB family protein [Dyella sp.]